jgi:hypothetical protein
VGTKPITKRKAGMKSQAHSPQLVIAHFEFSTYGLQFKSKLIMLNSEYTVDVLIKTRITTL